MQSKYMAASPNTNHLFITDCDRVLVYSVDGTVVRQWGSWGSYQGRFMNCRGIAVTAADEVVVADRNNHRVQVFRTDGTFVRMWSLEYFKKPLGVAVTPSGREVLVTEEHNHCVQVFRLADGTFVRRWGVPGSEPRQFNIPTDVCVTAAGEVSLA